MDSPASSEGEAPDAVTARGILKLLQLGKTVTVQVATPVEFNNLRSRIATLKSFEDKILEGLGMAEEPQSLLSECRAAIRVAAEDALVYDCIFKLGPKAAPRAYTIVSVE